MTVEMTKIKAEQILELKGSYDFATFTKAYRHAVKKNHPDVGGSQEKMIEINEAKSYLSTYFDDDKDAVITCSTSDTKYQSKTQADRDWAEVWEAVAKADEERRAAKKETEPQQSAETTPSTPTPTPVEKEEPKEWKPNYDNWAKKHPHKAAGMDFANTVKGMQFSVKRNYVYGKVPGWYRFLNTIVNVFYPRIIFWIICGWYANSLLLHSNGVSINDYTTLFILTGLTVANTIIPFLYPIRWGMRWLIDTCLISWGRKNGKKVEFDFLKVEVSD